MSISLVPTSVNDTLRVVRVSSLIPSRSSSVLRVRLRADCDTIRITSEDFTIDHILWPKLRDVLQEYTDIKVEFVIDYGLTDIVTERFDAGVRLGEMVSQGMIATRISPPQRMIVIGSPIYLNKHPKPMTPQDLTSHNCINLRLPTKGGLYAWEFEKNGQELRARVDGQMTCKGSRKS